MTAERLLRDKPFPKLAEGTQCFLEVCRIREEEERNKDRVIFCFSFPPFSLTLQFGPVSTRQVYRRNKHARSDFVVSFEMFPFFFLIHFPGRSCRAHLSVLVRFQISPVSGPLLLSCCRFCASDILRCARRSELRTN